MKDVSLTIALVLSICVLASGNTSAQVLIDPTKPLVPNAKSMDVTDETLKDGPTALSNSFSGLRLSAVFISATVRYAIINGEAIHEGKTRDNITIRKVNQDGVELFHNGELKQLNLNKVMTIREHEYKF